MGWRGATKAKNWGDFQVKTKSNNWEIEVKSFMDDSFASSSISRTELIVMLSDTTDFDDFINGGKDFL